jgi:ATP-dependent Lhr-like helicase
LNPLSVGDPLELFLPPVRQWFRSALGEPTAAQRQGWPAITAGRHTLILAPTGSGKTLAAFLACLDGLWRQDPLPRGVQVLYVSPLKALNQDIYRNLQVPLAGVARTASDRGLALPPIEVAVRTGDTSAAERQRLLRHPPHVLITTPESLHLLLTSRARETLRGVRHCIVDEIHSLCPNKRGVFLSLLLERLEAIQEPAGRRAEGGSFVRIGLSATQRPLDEVARFLGGLQWLPPTPTLPRKEGEEQPACPSATTGEGQPTDQVADGEPEGRFESRPVTIIDAGLRKDLDLQVVCPVPQFGAIAEKSVWPSIYRLLGDQVRRHRSTIIFANNRRTVERITAQLNEEEGVRNQGTEGREQESKDEGREVTDQEFGLGNPEGLLARAHHGSLALEVRQQTEQALKEGRLPAVVATGSLELGIDMGAVELVCQVESPGSVARGLQRVGRAGHLVGQKSKGRLIPKTSADLLEQAALAREMSAGRVEAIRVPINCLDVLAQQIVAMVAIEPWDVPALYALVRRAYPYRDLSPQAFETVLEMVSGRYRLGERDGSGPSSVPSAGQTPAADVGSRPADVSPLKQMAALAPRISWDRTHNRLHPLPGSRHLALVCGGTIPDTGQYGAYLASGVRIGELDEEFIYERRLGDAFLLGTNAWRLERIEADRVIVSAAEGAAAMVPFWRGENVGRSLDLGLAIGQLLRDLAERLPQPDCLDWLERECFLDAAAARNLLGYVRRQLECTGTLPTDRDLLIEACRDPLGDWQVILLTPLGHRLHLSLRFALQARLRQRLGYTPQCLHHDDGLLVRLADMDQPLLDLFDGLTPENVEALILDELADSALFALRFRQNAARALLLPRGRPGQRAPLWLQRLRSRDLLQVARRHPDFPIVAETLRECLHDHLDLDRLRQLLRDLRAGRVQVRTRRAEAPSPFAAGILFHFTAASMYQSDDSAGDSAAPLLDRQLLEQLVAPQRQSHLLDPRAIQQVERRLRGLGQPPRSASELAEWLRRLGDLSESDLDGPLTAFLTELEAAGRVCRLHLPQARQPLRWLLMEEEPLYRRAFGLEPAAPASAHQAAKTILRRFLDTHALVGLQDVLDRYPFDAAWAERTLREWTEGGRLVVLPGVAESPAPQYAVPDNLAQVRRSSLAILRREVVTSSPAQFADFLLRWQLVHPQVRDSHGLDLDRVLERLEGQPLSADLWESAVLPARLPLYQPRWLDEAIASGTWTWAGHGSADRGAGQVSFWKRDHLNRVRAVGGEPWTVDSGPSSSHRSSESSDGPESAAAHGARVLESLHRHGASFVSDLAQETCLAPTTVRSCLWELVRAGLVTNDQFDVVRKGEAEPLEPPPLRRAVAGPRLRARRPRPPFRPEGRWSLIGWGRPEPEEQALFLATLLLRRFGIAARELALLDPLMPPWRVLYEVLDRLELSGQVRRGYFVEGLSGAQFALPEAAEQLPHPPSAAAPLVLLHSLDPANLYGAGAPFAMAAGGADRPFLRRTGHWLVLRAGRPILLIEQQGRRLSTQPGASGDEIAQAAACLPALLERDRALAGRHKLTVESWNEEPVTASAGRPLLEAAGFVRDYQGMTLYAAWR